MVRRKDFSSTSALLSVSAALFGAYLTVSSSDAEVKIVTNVPLTLSSDYYLSPADQDDIHFELEKFDPIQRDQYGNPTCTSSDLLANLSSEILFANDGQKDAQDKVNAAQKALNDFVAGLRKPNASAGDKILAQIFDLDELIDVIKLDIAAHKVRLAELKGDEGRNAERDIGIALDAALKKAKADWTKKYDERKQLKGDDRTNFDKQYKKLEGLKGDLRRAEAALEKAKQTTAKLLDLYASAIGLSLCSITPVVVSTPITKSAPVVAVSTPIKANAMF